MFMKHNAYNRCEPRIEAIVKIPQNVGGGRCELVNCENAKVGWGGVGTVGEGGGGWDCEPRIEVIVKMQKKVGEGVRAGGGSGGGGGGGGGVM